MKKNIKLLAIGLIGFVLSLNAVSAKEIKDLNTLGNDVLAVNKNAEGFYLVGEYAFTTGYKTTVQDVMLAARSIQAKDQNGKINTDGIFKEMTIYTIDAQYNNSGEIDSWTIGKSLYGDNTLEEDLKSGIQVKYIDYQYLKEDVKIDTDTLLNTAFTSYNKPDLFTFNVNSLADGSVTATVQNLKENIALGMKSGVIDVLTKFLEDNSSVTSIDFATDIAGVEPFTFTRETTDTDIAAWVSNNLLKVLGENADGITADLIGKSFTATLNLGSSDTENYFAQKNDGKSVTYTITFDGTRSQVDVNGLVSTASKNSKLNGDLFEVSYDNNETISVTVKQPEKQIELGMGSGVIDTLKELLANENVRSITFTSDTAGVEPFTLTSETGDAEINAWLASNLLTALGDNATGITYDLIGKSFKAKVNLKSFAEKEADDAEEYIVTFAGEPKKVNVDKLVEDVATKTSGSINNDMFTATYNDGTVTVTVVDLDATIIKGMGSGVLATLKELLDTNADIESIDFATDIAGVEPFTYTRETTEMDIAGWVSNNLLKVLGEDADGITADLIGKSFTATVNLKYYAEKETTNKDKYTFNFTGTPKVVSGEELLKGGFIPDDSGTSVISDNLYSVKLEGKTLTVTAQDATTEIAMGMNSGVLVAMGELFKSPEVKSVEFSYEGLTFTYDANTTVETIGQWMSDNAEKIAQLFGEGPLTNEILKGKSVKAILNLKSSATFGSSREEEYTITFDVATRKLTFTEAKNAVVTVDSGKTISTESIPKADDKDGYKFAYWYDSTTNGKTEFDFNAPVTKDVTLTAKYLQLVSNTEIANQTTVENKINNSRNKWFQISSDKNVVTVNYNKKSFEGKTLQELASMQGTGINDALAELFKNKKLASIELVGYEGAVVTSSTNTMTLAFQMMRFLPKVAQAIAGDDDYMSMTFEDFWEKYKDVTVTVRLNPADDVAFKDDVMDEIVIKLGQTPFNAD